MMRATEATEPWPAERLREARGILADLAHQPDTRLLLAARIMIRHSPDETERKDARELQQFLDARSPASTSPQGGAA
jgi:hypothetical protein